MDTFNGESSLVTITNTVFISIHRIVINLIHVRIWNTKRGSSTASMAHPLLSPPLAPPIYTSHFMEKTKKKKVKIKK